MSGGAGDDRGGADRLPWFVYAVPIVLVARIVIYVIFASWIPAT